MFLPLFVVRTQLPVSLLMKVDTARYKSSLSMELAGRGHESQLHLSGGDITHTMTFQLTYVFHAGYLCTVTDAIQGGTKQPLPFNFIVCNMLKQTFLYHICSQHTVMHFVKAACFIGILIKSFNFCISASLREILTRFCMTHRFTFCYYCGLTVSD